ncbi:hypothetical protein EBS43_01265 [bacterium]|jgi:hypothetical protein|nr:hypothetical protein [bacterium]
MQQTHLHVALVAFTAIFLTQNTHATLPSQTSDQVPTPPPATLVKQIRVNRWNWAVHTARSLRVSYYEFMQVQGWRYAVEFRESKVFCITCSPSGRREEFEFKEPLMDPVSEE